MKILVAVMVYNRLHTLKNWLRAWKLADHLNSNLVIVQSAGGVDTRDVANLASEAAAYHLIRPNVGMDIGALQEIIRMRAVHPHLAEIQIFRDWDVLYWSTDDTLPMRPDFLRHFVDRFNDPRVGLVGNYLLPNETYETVPEHIRTVAFALRKEVAARLQFPSTLMSKGDCWAFEWGSHNMHKQVQQMGYLSIPADKDAWPHGSKPWYMCNDYVWDCGEINTGVLWDWRRQQDHSDRFEAQFKMGSQDPIYWEYSG
jgi:hypothetical protein